MRRTAKGIISGLRSVLFLPLKQRSCQSGKALEACLCWFLTFTAFIAPAWPQTPEAALPLALQGRLASRPGADLTLKTRKKDYPLAGKSAYLLHTLQDKRLLNRELRLEGTTRPDGRFEVSRVYTVRDGKLYKVRYFCEVCNIEALEPGPCVCCQQPTELQEIPLTEAKK